MPASARVAPWVTAVNAALSPADGLIRAATRREWAAPGAPDEAFLTGMRILDAHLRATPGLTPIGRLALSAEVGRRVANRRKVLDRLRGDPRIGAAPVTGPVFVTGLPRTGTTLLHGMLAQHSAARAPLLWEVLHPTATGREAWWRLRSARLLSAMYYAMVPAMRTIHPMSATEPEESVFLLPHSGVYLARAPMPGYRQWCEERDFGADYAYLKEQLQVLQWSSPGPAARWVLKSPFHLGHLDVVLDAFPDATIVITRRDPAASLASWCSFSEATRLMHNRHVDLAEIGRTWLDFWAAAARQATAVREEAGDRIIEVDYAGLAARPAGTTEELWRRMGASIAEKDRRAFARYAGRDRRRHPGSHHYTLERFGLDADQVSKAFDGTLVAVTS